MVKVRNIWKKILMVFAAAVLVLFGATEAFADENKESKDIMQEQSKTEEIYVGDTTESLIDYSVLERQITIAIGLNKQDYTTESWDVLRKALDEGISILDAAETQQEVIDKAGKLEDAVSALVRMDYSQLEKVLALLYGKIDENEEFYFAWGKVDSAMSNAKNVLTSGDQSAVDETVEELNALLEELSEIKIGEGETIVKEVEIQVPPTDDYCNIAGHKIWPVLFVMSAVLNAALVAIIGYVFSKMKNSQDDIPLVRYDIDDDIDGLEEFDDFDDYSEEETDDDETEEAFGEESGEED